MKKQLITGAGIVAGSLVAVSLLPSLAGAAVSKFQDVIVRNTDSEAIPTRTIGTSQVEVTNLPDAPTRERYATQVGFTAYATDEEKCGNDPVLPAGKRMVVESIVANVTLGETRPELSITGVGATHFIDLELAHPALSPADQAVWAGSSTVPFTLGSLQGGGVFDDPESAYTGPIGMVGAPCVVTNGELRGVQVQYHGYLEDVPQP